MSTFQTYPTGQTAAPASTATASPDRKVIRESLEVGTQDTAKETIGTPPSIRDSASTHKENQIPDEATWVLVKMCDLTKVIPNSDKWVMVRNFEFGMSSQQWETVERVSLEAAADK